VCYVLGRDFTRLQALQQAGVALSLVQLPCDITDEEALEAQLARVTQPLDEFVNTIGTFCRARALDMDRATIQGHFELNTIANIRLTQLVVPLLKPGFAQILVCLASLAIAARENYALQCATKAGYKLFVDTIRIELKEQVRVMTVCPPSVNTNIFAKGGDTRDTAQYVEPSHIADAMKFMLDQSPQLVIPELVIQNR